MNIALVGSGKIVLSCLDALSRVDGVTIYALCVRESSREKGETLQQQYAIPHLYTDYQQLLQDEQVDFIYLGIPNNLHYVYARMALENNRHVICEKPLTSNLNEASQLIGLAKSRRLFLFEAITSIHTPAWQWLQSQLPSLGPLRLVQCNYSQYSSRYDDYQRGIIHPAFDPAMSGGALYDINLYNVYITCALFGAPLAVHYHCNQGANGIDTSGVLLLQYTDFIAVCCGAKDSASPGGVTVQGSLGYARITDTPNICGRAEVVLNNGQQYHRQPSIPNHMEYEFQAFRDCFLAQDYARCYAWLDIAQTVSSVLEQARHSANIIFAGDENRPQDGVK